MEVRRVVTPVLDRKLDYIWLSHGRPWTLNAGKVIDVSINKTEIRVKFAVTLSEAVAAGCWDAKNKRVYQEVYDKHGLPVMTGWLDMRDRAIVSATLGLRETNDV